MPRCSSQPANAHAAWPEKPVRIIMTFPGWRRHDMVGRARRNSWPRELGQPVMIDNKAGAGGTIDGLPSARSTGWLHADVVQPRRRWRRPVHAARSRPTTRWRSFTHIAQLGSAPLVIMATPKPGPATRKTWHQGTGASQDFGSAARPHQPYPRRDDQARRSPDMVHVPSRGSAPMTTDLIAGHHSCRRRRGDGLRAVS